MAEAKHPRSVPVQFIPSASNCKQKDLSSQFQKTIGRTPTGRLETMLFGITYHVPREERESRCRKRAEQSVGSNGGGSTEVMLAHGINRREEMKSQTYKRR